MQSHIYRKLIWESHLLRDMEGTSAERGTFSPAFLLLCADAAPEIGSYFDQKSFIEIRDDFDAMMRTMYPNDLYQDQTHVSWGRIMFVIDGIVVYQALEGDGVAQWRFRVCRCPLPVLLRSMEPQSVQVWISGCGQVRYQDRMEHCWRQGWSMYDWHVLEQHNIHIEDSDEDDNEATEEDDDEDSDEGSDEDDDEQQSI